MKYINWKEVADPGKPKPKKVPCDQQGKEIDAHAPSSWASWEEVSAAPYHIGVVLTESDPYFLIDLDDCRDPVTGAFTAQCDEVVRMFPGAALEVSHNGTGFHIMGCLNPVVLGDRRNRFKLANGLDIEFYHTGRFVALGQGMTGDINLDWTATLAQFVPVRVKGDITSLVDETDPEYTGPEDDDDLIKMMIAAKGSNAQIFGDKASVADLWTADVAVLSKHFPSPAGDDFNHSDADAALMSHLAFYTGKNSARMDRLFRRSGLMREKYDKRVDQYAIPTVSNAVSACKMVYNKPRQEILQASSEGAVVKGQRVDEWPEFLSAAEQVEYFKGCVYVAANHGVMVPGGTVLSSTRFKAMYGGHQFVMSADSSKPTMNAFDAFTENRVVRFPKVSQTTFRPDLDHATIVNDAVNVFMPLDIKTENGDVAPFLQLMEKLLPDEQDRAQLLAYMCSVIQNQGVKFLWAPFIQGTKGNGKSFLAECMTYSIGERYCWTVKAKKIDAQFNKFLQNRIFINVDEMNMFNRYELLESLKEYITGSRQEVELKGIDSNMVNVVANWWFNGNEKGAIIKEQDDRRFAPFFTAQQSREDMRRDGMLSDDYFPRLWDWARKGGFAYIRHFLMTHEIPAEMDPAGKCFMAPETSATAESVSLSWGTLEQHILECVEAEEPGFRGGWVSTWAVNQMIDVRRLRKVSPRHLGDIIQKLGFEKRGRSGTPIFDEGTTRPMLYAKPGTTAEYPVAQQYSSPKFSTVGGGLERPK